MPTNNENNYSDFLNNWQNNSQYFEMLKVMAKLSRLFSENEIPYLDYRLTENLFCKYYDAINDARSCTAYDARIKALGIGIKTFIISNDSSTEKIAEFNKLRPELNLHTGKELAIKIAEFRNSRMQLAIDTFNVTDSIYHIVGRQIGQLRIFNVPYEKINIENIHLDKDTPASISFYDDKNFYTFNKSKSVLQKRFQVPKIFKDINVEIIDEPLNLLLNLSKSDKLETYKAKQKGIDYVVLPLYNEKTYQIPEKSGLNQWNAGGRKRNENEVYIPIPIKIHQLYPTFFPKRDEPFLLELPDGKMLNAKVCQDNGKALMSNPNSDLGEWILRKILKKKVGELVTMNDLFYFGIDSIYIEKVFLQEDAEIKHFRISFTNVDYERYSDFIE
jgi:hypothetical protein